MNCFSLFCVVISIATVVLSVDAGGSCRSESAIKQCVYQNYNSDKDLGALMKCSFFKTRSETALRVTFQGTMRIIGCRGGCCRRWFITINGKECTSPATIDTRVFATGNVNRHTPGTLDGFCANIPRGYVNVGVSLGYCLSHSNRAGNAYTGWETVSRLIIEEVPALQ